jgi:hypothetical protein
MWRGSPPASIATRTTTSTGSYTEIPLDWFQFTPRLVLIHLLIGVNSGKMRGVEKLTPSLHSNPDNYECCLDRNTP